MGERCRDHGYYDAGVGICSVCLTERLAKVAQNKNLADNNNNVYVQAANLERVPESSFERNPSVCMVGNGGTRRRSNSLSALFTSDFQASEGRANGGAAFSDKEKFICLDFQQRESKSSSWVFSSLLRKSKCKERNSFSGRPSLDNVLSKKMGAYEKEVVRRQEALKAGGWEVQLCSDCDAEETGKEKEVDYYSDSSVSTKHRIRSLFRKQKCKANLQGVCKEKKNPRVANCVLAGAVENGGADHFGVRKYTSWTKTLASPLWKPKSGRKKDVSMAASSFACTSSPLRQGSSSSLWYSQKAHCNSSARK
ncbi:uncharacterized protein LOC131060693 [Cryptomeria japonica]|uniref:uncharacterized protein LOC131060693 n=1 Tax=Cryptomeria japonica TaxID=3369 RepID=UPI0027DA97B3|nr:uncharacterized protein LOC131060693 [Cryptomeria japonica]